MSRRLATVNTAEITLALIIQALYAITKDHTDQLGSQETYVYTGTVYTHLQKKKIPT